MDTPRDERLIRASMAELGISRCALCGSALAEIRGKHPGGPRRKVCPCCLQERLERIHAETSPDHGVAYEAPAPPAAEEG